MSSIPNYLRNYVQNIHFSPICYFCCHILDNCFDEHANVLENLNLVLLEPFVALPGVRVIRKFKMKQIVSHRKREDTIGNW